MPIYTYQCACGLRFERNVPMSDRAVPVSCTDCGAEASRLVPDDITGVFKLETNGPGPQNTGVSQMDAVADRAIGVDAEKGWKVVEKRQGVKSKILTQNPGVGRGDLSRQPDGSYKILAPEEKQVQKRALGINNLAMKLLQQREGEISPPNQT